MSKLSGKVQAKSRQTTTGQTASKAFAVRPFPEIAKKEEGKEASIDPSGTKDIQPGTAIANINSAIASVSPPVPSQTVLPGGVQAKLTLGAPGDKYEQEADRVARQVVDEIHSNAFRANNTKSEGESQPNDGEAGRVQRQITVRAAGDAGGEISSEWEGELQRARSGGQPLSPSVREPMEGEFGADFGGVRVHTGAQADRLARSIQAKAFTTGEDVFFRQGAYEPGSRGGQELIAHELTHVLQHKGEKKVRRSLEKYDNREDVFVDPRYKGIYFKHIDYREDLEQKVYAVYGSNLNNPTIVIFDDDVYIDVSTNETWEPILLGTNPVKYSYIYKALQPIAEFYMKEGKCYLCAEKMQEVFNKSGKKAAVVNLERADKNRILLTDGIDYNFHYVTEFMNYYYDAFTGGDGMPKEVYIAELTRINQTEIVAKTEG